MALSLVAATIPEIAPGAQGKLFDSGGYSPYHAHMQRVSIERVTSYDRELVASGLQRLLEPLGGMAAFVRPGERVLIKPNLLMGTSPEAAVTTHPVLVRGVIEAVKRAGAVPLVGDSPGIGSYRKITEQTGIAAVCRESGAELVEFRETVTVRGSGLFREIQLARPYLEADRIINLPKLKTHEMMTMTCAVKNLFGAVVGTAKAGWHLKAGADRELFARMLLEICLHRPPDLTIVDAIVAMEGNGPSSGSPKEVGLLLAGDNAVAVDLIAGEIAGIPRKLLFVEQAARKLAVAGARRESIVTVGLPFRDACCPVPFCLPPLSDVQFGLPRFLKNRLRSFLTTRPVVNPGKCVLCGVCRDTCPPGAITIRAQQLRIDCQACIRCFCCRELCPHHALNVEEGVILRFVKKFGTRNDASRDRRP
jgi:uncharacterized protein (DUF362 family)/Pyruvate/2-oxoacid:ferredoxin oxidoreductase delta subunit